LYTAGKMFLKCYISVTETQSSQTCSCSSGYVGSDAQAFLG